MTKLADAQVSFMIRNGLAVTLSSQPDAKDNQYTCFVQGNFGENSVLGVWSRGYNSYSLSVAIDNAYDDLKKNLG